MIEGYIDFSLLNREASAPFEGLCERGEVATAGLSLKVGSGAKCFVQGHQLLVLTGAPDIRDARLLQAIKREGWQAQVSWFLADPKGMLEKLGGRFSVLWMDTKKALVGASCDRFATYGFCYAKEGSRISFSDQADKVPALDRTLNAQAVFNYFYFHVIAAPQTIFTHVKRLEPASLMSADARELKLTVWWNPMFDEPPKANKASLVQPFLNLMEEAVRREAAGFEGQIGAFLSGGTDSSTVVGMLSQVSKAPVKAYSIGFEAQGYDEMAYAQIAAKHFGAEHHAYYVTPADLVAGIASVAAHYDQPFGNSSALPAYYCAKLAHSQGIAKLLAGDGGDEFFGGNTRYAKQRVFGYYNRIPSFLRAGVMEPILSQGWAKSTPLIKKAVSYVEQAKQPMPERLDQYNLLLNLGLGKVFEAGFLEQVDASAPMRLQQQVWDCVQAQALVNKMLGFDWRFTLSDNDLPKVIGTTTMAGVQVGFPFLNEDLVDFSMDLPPEFKLRGLKLRWFFKEALKGFLPPQILTKKKHGFGLPFGPWAIKDAALNKLAKQSLEALASRGVLQEDFLKKLFDEHLPAHPGYYGEMVWVSMMLEQWLQAKAPAFTLR